MSRYNQIVNVLSNKLMNGEITPDQYDALVAQAQTADNNGTLGKTQQTSSMLGSSGGLGDLSSLFDGSGLNGYSDGFVTSNPGAAMNSPGFQSALGNMMNAYASMYGADASARGQIGAAEQGKLGTLGAAQSAADASKYGADQNLKGVDLATLRNLLGIQDTNKTNLGISNNQLAGVKDTNLANTNIADIQGNAQMGTASINQGPAYEKLNLLAQYLGLGGTPAPTGGLGGVPSNVGTIGGATIDLGGGSSSGTGTNNPNQQQGPYAPIVPQFQNFNSIMANQQKANANADIATQAATQARDYQRNRMGAGGMSNRGGVDAQMGVYKMGAMGDMARNNTQIDLGVPQYNAQNAIAYSNMAANMYNAEQDRANRLQLAKTLNPGTIISALA